MYSLVFVRSKTQFQVGQIMRSFDLGESLYYVREVKTKPDEYYYVMEFPYGKHDHKEIYNNYMKPIFSDIGIDNVLQVKEFDFNNRFKEEGDNFQCLYVVNQKNDVISELFEIINCLFIGGFTIQEGELYHKVISVRPDDNYHLYHFLKNFTHIICKKQLALLPAVDFSNVNYVRCFQEQIEGTMLKSIYLAEPEPTVVKSAIINGETLRVMFENQRDAENIINRMNHGVWDGKEICAKLSFNVNDLTPDSDPASNSGSDFKSKFLVGSRQQPNPASGHKKKQNNPILQVDNKNKNQGTNIIPFKQFIISNFINSENKNGLSKVLKGIIMDNIVLLDPNPKLAAVEHIISVESPTKENLLIKKLETYVCCDKAIPYYFTYSKDTLESDRKNKIKELLEENAVEFTFDDSDDLPPIISIINSLYNSLNTIVRCAAYDEKNERKFYVSFNTKEMQQRALTQMFRIRKKTFTKSEYNGSKALVKDNIQDLKLSFLTMSEDSVPKIKRIKSDIIDDDILFLSKNQKISGIITFKSPLAIDEIEEDIRGSMLKGSGTFQDLKKNYCYAVNVGDGNGLTTFIQKHPNVGNGNARFIELNKMIISFPPGIKKEIISLLFSIPINTISEFNDKCLIGLTSFVIRFSNIKQSKKFNSFMLEKERCIKKHIVFAYNSCEVTKMEDRKKVFDFIVNQKDSYPVFIQNIPYGSCYNDLNDLLLFSKFDLDEDFEKMIKIKLVSPRPKNNRTLCDVIVVYSTAEAKDFAIKNIKEFNGKTITCVEYNVANKRKEIENDADSEISFDTQVKKTVLSPPSEGRQFVWDDDENPIPED